MLLDAWVARRSANSDLGRAQKRLGTAEADQLTKCMWEAAIHQGIRYSESEKRNYCSFSVKRTI